MRKNGPVTFTLNEMGATGGLELPFFFFELPFLKNHSSCPVRIACRAEGRKQGDQDAMAVIVARDIDGLYQTE